MSYSTKSPAPGRATVSEPKLVSLLGKVARSGVRVDQCVSAIGAVQLTVILMEPFVFD